MLEGPIQKEKEEEQEEEWNHVTERIKVIILCMRVGLPCCILAYHIDDISMHDSHDAQVLGDVKNNKLFTSNRKIRDEIHILIAVCKYSG